MDSVLNIQAEVIEESKCHISEATNKPTYMECYAFLKRTRANWRQGRWTRCHWYHNPEISYTLRYTAEELHCWSIQNDFPEGYDTSSVGNILADESKIITAGNDAIVNVYNYSGQ